MNEGMLEYYDERAGEYDQVYSGEFSGSTDDDRRVYSADTAALTEVVRRFSKGALLDAPCGTAFWLPAYAANVNRIVLVDQSARMLSQARTRVRDAGLDKIATFAQGDLLDCTWPDQSFDTALLGFFFSHLTSLEMKRFLIRLRASFRPNGQLVLLDSLWTSVRAQARPKEGLLRRRLNDGREFNVYKRYFEASDIIALSAELGFDADIQYVGNAFLAAILRPSAA